MFFFSQVTRCRKARILSIATLGFALLSTSAWSDRWSGREWNDMSPAERQTMQRERAAAKTKRYKQTVHASPSNKRKLSAKQIKAKYAGREWRDMSKAERKEWLSAK